MEVSNVRDHVTHATISGNKAIDFGISDSPEFFHILSSTLYSDQPLAVVREVLCNAWDAHIEAGCANKPVEVTLTDEELVIRDFGKGIHEDDIGPVYGVYGGSTKKKNRLVTGGFGLGCKAPFAYTDHFEVISCHAGKRTIYNMSKSSAEVHGRPGIVPITTLPTDETGLQVRIQLKNRNDRYRFQELVKRIASNGEMSILLNGDPVDVLPFSSMKHGFMVTHLPVTENHHDVLIRYGHVVYPVERHEDYGTEYKTISRFLESLPEMGYSIIFQAKPDSISVTPSRESLSMQEHTIKTLTEIFQDFCDVLESRLQEESFNILESSIVETWTRMRPSELFSTERTIPGLSKRQFNKHSDDYSVMVELPTIARARVTWNYPDYQNFRYRDLLARVDSLIQANFGNTGLVNSYRSELIRLHRRKQLAKIETNWFHRKILGPLIRDLKAAEMNTKRLSVYGRSGDNNNFRWNETYFTEATKYACRPLEDVLPFIRNIVVLTHNREAVEDRVHQFPIMKHWLGKASNFLVYNVPRTSKAKTDQARDFFKARGVELIDLTVYHSWETAPVPINVEAKEKPKPRPKGLPILGCLLNGGIRMDFLDFEDEERDIKRTTEPDVVVKMSRSEDRKHCLPDFSREATRAICTLWPNDIAVAISSVQLLKYTAAGAIGLNDFVIKQVCAEIQSNKRIQRAFSFDFDRIERAHAHHWMEGIFELIWEDAGLRKKFGLANDLTETDRLYITLWEDLCDRYRWTRDTYPELKKTAELVDKIKTAPAVMKLSNLMETRRAQLGVIDVQQALRNLLSTKDSPETKTIKDLTRKIVLLALKG